jgi:hypothetical protein
MPAHFPLAKQSFAMQSHAMDSNWASEQLQTIRTLMERSALYRRALAPIMLWNGLVGVAGSAFSWRFPSDAGFMIFWSCVAIVALAGSFLLVRRQSLKDSEPFWSPPTRRVAQALLPALFIGCFLNCLFAYFCVQERGCLPFRMEHTVMIVIWMWLYGCAVHAAGFFMTRGIKLFGWIFILGGCALGLFNAFCELRARELSADLLMGSIFGGLHLIYGIYLYLTEKGKPAA